MSKHRSKSAEADVQTVHPGEAPEEIEVLDSEGPEELDTYDEPPVNEITVETLQARRQNQPPTSGRNAGVPLAKNVEVPNVFYEEIEDTQEGGRLVPVTPLVNFDCFIGNRHWYFEKNKRVMVPKSVQEVLSNARKIAP